MLIHISVDCLLELLNPMQNGEEEFLPVEGCECHPPCRAQEILLINSYSALRPSSLARLLKLSNSTPSSIPSPQWLAENTLLLNVWFDGADYEANNQGVEYTVLQASNELGGQMLLWCGISVVNVVEFGALLVMLVAFFAYGKNVRVIPTEEEFSEDPRYRVGLGWGAGGTE